MFDHGNNQIVKYSDGLVLLAREASLAFLQECATDGTNHCMDNPLRSKSAPLYSRYLKALREENQPYPKAIRGQPILEVHVPCPTLRSYADYFDDVLDYAAIFGVEVPAIVAARFAEADGAPAVWEADRILTEQAKGLHWLTCAYSGGRPSDQGYIHHYDVGCFPKVEMGRSAVEVWWPLLRYYVAPVLLVAPDGTLHDFSYENNGDPNPGTGELPPFGLWDPVNRPL